MIPRCLDLEPRIPLACRFNEPGKRGSFVVRLALLCPAGEAPHDKVIFAIACFTTTYSTN